MNPQSVQVDIGPKGTIYVRQSEVFSDSREGAHGCMV